MNNLLSLIFKQKKIIFPILLFFVLVAIFIPTTSSAVTYLECINAGGTVAECLVTQGNPVSEKEIAAVAAKTGLDITETQCGLLTSDGRNNCIIGFLKAFSYALSWICDYFAYYSSLLFELVLNTVMKNAEYSITRTVTPTGQPTVAGAVFLATWNIVKNWANMLIVLGLLGVAIAMILGLKEYGSRKLLGSIILVALLVNFSVVFVGLMIDASNMTFASIAGGGESSLYYKTNAAWNNTVLTINVIDYKSLYNYVALVAVFDAIYISIGITLLIFTSILIQRYVILAILFILSPLAFVFFVLPIPKAKELFTKWWSYFIKWCFIGLGGAFFLRLSVDILGAFPASSWIINDAVADLPRLIFQIYTIEAFLVIGLIITVKSGGPVADFIMKGAKMVGMAALAVATSGASLVAGGVMGGIAGAAKGVYKGGERMGAAGAARGGVAAGLPSSIAGAAGGGIMGGIRGALKGGRRGLRRDLGVADVVGGAKRGVTRMGEAIGLADQGTANLAYQEAMKEKMKPYEPLAEAEKNSDVLAKRAMNSSTGEERAVYTKKLQERNKLHLIQGSTDAETQTLRQTAIDNAKKYGIDTSKYAESHFEYAALDDKRVEDVMKKRKLSGAAGRAVAEQLVTREQLAQNLPSMSDNQRVDIDKKYLVDLSKPVGDPLRHDFVIENFTPSIVKSYKLAVKSKRASLRNARTEIKSRITEVEKGGPKEDPAEFNRLRNLLKAINKVPA